MTVIPKSSRRERMEQNIDVFDFHLSDEEMQELIDATPLMRIGKPEDVAHAARFFEQNTFTTAQVLGVDGGFC